MKPLGLYIHIPFCRSKCLYCDFYSSPCHTDAELDAYLSALLRDLEGRSEECRGYTVDTVYLGGGTPTLLGAKRLEQIMKTVTNKYSLASDAEITSECNPATGDRALFCTMRAAGFNRLSIGLQSTHEEELRALGRAHTYADFLHTWEDARGAGFDNLALDLMSGIPHQTPERFRVTLERAVALSPEHISAYGLQVEPETPFGRMSEEALALPDEEAARQMYLDTVRILSAAGILQYEISNFARPGYESRHNLKYWECGEFLGFGPAAYSDFKGARSGNLPDRNAYSEGRDITTDRETPDRSTRIAEAVMLGMRLSRGICIEAFDARYGISFAERYGRALERYIPMGLVEHADGCYRLTPEGMYVSNAILSDLLDFA